MKKTKNLFQVPLTDKTPSNSDLLSEIKTKAQIEKINIEAEKHRIMVQRARDELIDKTVVSNYFQTLVNRINHKLDILVGDYPEKTNGLNNGEKQILFNNFKKEFIEEINKPINLSNGQIIDEDKKYSERKLNEKAKRDGTISRELSRQLQS
jgi:hypothetical protein